MRQIRIRAVDIVKPIQPWLDFCVIRLALRIRGKRPRHMEEVLNGLYLLILEEPQRDPVLKVGVFYRVRHHLKGLRECRCVEGSTIKHLLLRLASSQLGTHDQGQPVLHTCGRPKKTTQFCLISHPVRQDAGLHLEASTDGKELWWVSLESHNVCEHGAAYIKLALHATSPVRAKCKVLYAHAVLHCYVEHARRPH